MSVQLSRGQLLVLQAASRVDYLPFRAKRQINLENGVWRALVIRGFMRPVSKGWQVTPEGRRLLINNDVLVVDKRNGGTSMTGNGKLPRYSVTRTTKGWAVIDRQLSKDETHDVIEVLPSRHAARMKAGQLNLAATEEHQS